MIIPEYLAGLVNWGAIGRERARAKCIGQLVRVCRARRGFKNGTSGDVQVTIEAIPIGGASSLLSRP